MCNVGRSSMHWNYFNKRNRKVCCQTSLLLWGILNACTGIVALEGRCVLEQISHNGCGSHVFVGNSSVDLYAKCGNLKDAGRLSNKMPSYDVVTWNAIILGRNAAKGKRHRNCKLIFIKKPLYMRFLICLNKHIKNSYIQN
jgi:hypothetical protein